MGTVRWLGHLFRMQELDPCRRLTLLKPEGTRRLGKLQLRWLESVEEDMKKIGRGELETCHRAEKIGGQFWKRLSFTENCNAR